MVTKSSLLSLNKNTTYVDSSAFIAVLDSSDTFYNKYHILFSDPPKLVTTTLVINETHSWFLRRYDSYKAIMFLNFIEALKPLEILSVDKKLLNTAIELIKKYSDQKLTLVDTTGIALMKQEKIVSCWSTDSHLTLGGAKSA